MCLVTNPRYGCVCRTDQILRLWHALKQRGLGFIAALLHRIERWVSDVSVDAWRNWMAPVGQPLESIVFMFSILRACLKSGLGLRRGVPGLAHTMGIRLVEFVPSSMGCSRRALYGAFVVALWILAACATPTLAHGAPQGQEAAGDARPVSPWQVDGGALALIFPEYEGAKKYDVLVVPLIAVDYKRRFFINFFNGAGVYLINDDKLKLGAGIGYLMGREEDDGPRLQGLGDVDGGAVVNLFSEYAIGRYSFGLKYRNQVSGANTGYLVSLDAAYGQNMGRKLILKYGATVNYASTGYMTSFFGVSASQATASGLAPHSVDAGIKGAGLELTTIYLIAQPWSIQGFVKYERLLGDAADSPVVVNENQFGLALGLAYRF